MSAAAKRRRRDLTSDAQLRNPSVAAVAAALSGVMDHPPTAAHRHCMADDVAALATATDAELTASPFDGLTPAHLAAAANATQALRYIDSRGGAVRATLFVAGVAGTAPCHVAAYMDSADAFVLLLSIARSHRLPSPAQLQSHDNMLPGQVAAVADSARVIDAIAVSSDHGTLDVGASTGTSAAYYAARNDAVRALRSLQTSGVDLRTQAKLAHNRTIAHAAAESNARGVLVFLGNEPLFRSLLLQADVAGDTPAHMAAYHDADAALYALGQFAPRSMVAFNDRAMTPAHVAAVRNASAALCAIHAQGGAAAATLQTPTGPSLQSHRTGGQWEWATWTPAQCAAAANAPRALQALASFPDVCATLTCGEQPAAVIAGMNGAVDALRALHSIGGRVASSVWAIHHRSIPRTTAVAAAQSGSTVVLEWLWHMGGEGRQSLLVPCGVRPSSSAIWTAVYFDQGDSVATLLSYFAQSPRGLASIAGPPADRSKLSELIACAVTRGAADALEELLKHPLFREAATSNQRLMINVDELAPTIHASAEAVSITEAAVILWMTDTTTAKFARSASALLRVADGSAPAEPMRVAQYVAASMPLRYLPDWSRSVHLYATRLIPVSIRLRLVRARFPPSIGPFGTVRVLADRGDPLSALDQMIAEAHGMARPVSLDVMYADEAAGGDGLRREWLAAAVGRLCDEESGLLVPTEDGDAYMMRSDAGGNVSDGCIQLGLLIGVALAHGETLGGVQLAVPLVAGAFGLTELSGELRTGARSTVRPMRAGDALRAVDRECHAGRYAWVVAATADEWNEAGLELSFDDEVDGLRVGDYLNPDHGDLVGPVRYEQRVAYAEAYATARVFGPHLEQFPAVRHGIQIALCAPFVADLQRLCTSEELTRLVCGAAVVDVNEWRASTRYTAGYTGDSPVVEWLWTWVSQSQEHARWLLAFATGSRAPPCDGMGAMAGYRDRGRSFEVTKAVGSWMSGGGPKLPTAATCVNTLVLPEYPDYQALEFAMDTARRIGAAFDETAVGEMMPHPEHGQHE